jgi:predicted negative regulator of RcsB-dependent stress response
MATHYNLEEQEQLAQLKHFWAKYGNLITWLLIAVLGAFAAWNAWQFWQQKAATEAAALYDELDRAAQAQDTERVRRVWADVQKQGTGSAQAHQAGLLAARVLHEANALADARQALVVVVEKSPDAGVVAVARLRLAAIEIEDKAFDAALKWLEGPVPEEFNALVADRRGDALWAKGDADGARKAYGEAWAAMASTLEYRRILEAKLNALGVDPDASTRSGNQG